MIWIGIWVGFTVIFVMSCRSRQMAGDKKWYLSNEVIVSAAALIAGAVTLLLFGLYWISGGNLKPTLIIAADIQEN